jgi:hypothetical protein
MISTPHDLVKFIRTANAVTCDECGIERIIDGERSRYSVAEYLIKKGWLASEDEDRIVCGTCAKGFLLLRRVSSTGKRDTRRN